MPTTVTTDTNQEFRALSIRQPWASLLASGLKTVETRTRNTTFRGEFYIHASKAFPIKAYEQFYLRDPELRYYINKMLGVDVNTRLTFTRMLDLLPTGALVGKATLVDSMTGREYQKMMESGQKLVELERERTLGNFDDNRYAWLTTGQTRLITPVPCKGKESYFWPIPTGSISVLL